MIIMCILYSMHAWNIKVYGVVTKTIVYSVHNHKINTYMMVRLLRVLWMRSLNSRLPRCF